MGHHGKRVLRTQYRIWALVSWFYGVFKEAELYSALSGSRDNSIIVYLNRMKLKLHLLKKEWSLISAKVGEILWFGEFVSYVLRHNYRVVLFLS